MTVPGHCRNHATAQTNNRIKDEKNLDYHSDGFCLACGFRTEAYGASCRGQVHQRPAPRHIHRGHQLRLRRRSQCPARAERLLRVQPYRTARMGRRNRVEICDLRPFHRKRERLLPGSAQREQSELYASLRRESRPFQRFPRHDRRRHIQFRLRRNGAQGR